MSGNKNAPPSVFMGPKSMNFVAPIFEISRSEQKTAASIGYQLRKLLLLERFELINAKDTGVWLAEPLDLPP